MVGKKQILNRRSKMEKLIGMQIVAYFTLPTQEEIQLISSVEKRNGHSGQGYYLSVYGIQLPLKHSKPESYEHIVRVTVQKGSIIEQKLNEIDNPIIK